MRVLFGASVFAVLSLLSAASGADEACEPGFACLKPVTIYGRPPKPIVVVELARPTAASAAGAAHDALRAEWMQKLEPATLRPSQAR